VSGDQGADQRAEKSLASFACVMDELEEPEVDREFLLRVVSETWSLWWFCAKLAG